MPRVSASSPWGVLGVDGVARMSFSRSQKTARTRPRDWRSKEPATSKTSWAWALIVV